MVLFGISLVASDTGIVSCAHWLFVYRCKCSLYIPAANIFDLGS